MIYLDTAAVPKKLIDHGIWKNLKEICCWRMNEGNSGLITILKLKVLYSFQSIIVLYLSTQLLGFIKTWLKVCGGLLRDHCMELMRIRIKLNLILPSWHDETKDNLKEQLSSFVKVVKKVYSSLIDWINSPPSKLFKIIN